MSAYATAKYSEPRFLDWIREGRGQSSQQANVSSSFSSDCKCFKCFFSGFTIGFHSVDSTMSPQCVVKAQCYGLSL
jgi:hypothetical protein